MANLKRVPLIGDLAKLIGFLQGNFRDFRLGGEKLHGMIRFDATTELSTTKPMLGRAARLYRICFAQYSVDCYNSGSSSRIPISIGYEFPKHFLMSRPRAIFNNNNPTILR